MRLSRDWYLPKKYSAKIVPKGVKAEIYLFDNGYGPVAMGFGGRRSKPDFNIRFKDKERRAAHVKKYVESLEAHDKYSAKNRKDRNEKGRGLEVGDVLYCSWGYDQTNINYYEVIKLVGKKSVMIVPINSHSVSDKPPQNMVAPLKGSLAEWDVLLGADRGWQEKQPEGWLKRAVDGRVSINDHQSASKCDPLESRYETSSGWGH